MAIASQPSIEELCRTALRRASQPNPTPQMVNRCVIHQFQEVKADIRLRAHSHRLLRTNAMTVTTKGMRRYAQPSDANEIESVMILHGPDDYRLTVSAYGAGLVTLPSTLNVDDDLLAGQTLATLSGEGNNQYEMITAWNNTTKVATLATTPTAALDTTTTVLIATDQLEIYNSEPETLRRNQIPGVLNLPTKAAMDGENLWLNTAPDKVYPLIWTYYIDIDQIDENSALFKKILREWRSVIMEGLVSKTMVEMDDARQYEHTNLYNGYLHELAQDSLTITQSVPYE